jgi:hypothetical protein
MPLGFDRSQVTTDIGQALRGDVDTIFVATVVMAHEALAHLLAPLVQPHQLVVLNPGNLGNLNCLGPPLFRCVKGGFRFWGTIITCQTYFIAQWDTQPMSCTAL